MNHLERTKKSRGLVVVGKPERKLTLIDRIFKLWLSTSRNIDGLWLGTSEDKPYPASQRIEEALLLIKRHDPLNYSRIIGNLDRIWVSLLPSALAHYDRSLNACVFDERHVVQETTTIEWIASTIVHETTHARLDGWGIIYHEKDRYRIEAICLRREMNFLAKLPDAGPLREEVARTLEWCATDRDFLSDASFQERHDRGEVEILRHLNVPRCFVRLALWVIWRRRLRAFASAKP
ncbi:MAG: hypothetical protein GY844_05235 [Bradyrhizobium sp.]|nr:hypothetical protein [Bradyrhizobium sp.]